MKNIILVSVIFASIGLGYAQSKSDVTSAHEKQQVDTNLQKWVGKYQGSLPCAACVSRCEGCEGVGYDLELFQDQSFTLLYRSNQDNSVLESHRGRFEFLDDGKLQIELHPLKARNILVYTDDGIEILDSVTMQPYIDHEDFMLQKMSS